ncbi:MAG: LysM domain-containing protein [Chloroflexota bacterium]|nr:LysM domain-containing protein [Chloroflexota bacterium]
MTNQKWYQALRLCLRDWRILTAATLIAVMIAVIVGPPIISGGANGGYGERISNGDFERGFGPEGVGLGWSRFDNGGKPNYHWYDEAWAPAVGKGQHSQGIEIDTKGKPDVEPDRYAGIHQTVAVQPGCTYQLSFRGMLRALEGDPDRHNWSYVVQYGVDYSGGTDWRGVDNWVIVPWDEVYPRTQPGDMMSYHTSFTAQTERLTLFIRVWKKWPSGNGELILNLDSISLRGCTPQDVAPPSVEMSVRPDCPIVGESAAVCLKAVDDVEIAKLELYDNEIRIGDVNWAPGPPAVEGCFAWTPTSAGIHTLKSVAFDAGGTQAAVTQLSVPVGDSLERIYNGGFEAGFGPEGVGLGWSRFDNGGKPNYHWYDEAWAPAVGKGQHSQGIEIDTKGKPDVEPDRYAGIHQTVAVQPGCTYQLSFRGMLRALEGDPDRHNWSYVVQYGVDYSGGTDWRGVDNWVIVPWDEVYPRTQPGDMMSYHTSFTAQTERLTLFIRVWKKWPSGNGELILNLDSISLKGYTAPSDGDPPAVAVVVGDEGDTYTVQQGDYMAKIARQLDVSLSDLIEANPQVTDPNLIHVGQKLRIPNK